MVVFQYKEGEWQVVVDGRVRVRTDHSSEMGAICAVGMLLKLLASGELEEGTEVVLGPGVTPEQLSRGYAHFQRVGGEELRWARLPKLASEG